MTYPDRFLLRPLGPEKFMIFDRKLGSTVLCRAASVADIDFDALRVSQDEAAGDRDAERFDSRLPFSTVLVNTTEACNLRCQYCARYKTNYAPRMVSHKTLVASLRRASEQGRWLGERVVVQFHGGEPTIALKRIKGALEALAPSELESVDLRMQTNGTLIDDALIQLCTDYDIHLGVSIDGPPEINGIHRRFIDGRPVADVLHRNLARIRAELPRNHVSCLCVLSTANVRHAEEAFDYILSQGIDDLSILPLYPDFAACPTDACSIVPRTDEMIAFSAKIFDLWIERLRSGAKLCIPSFQIWFWNLLGSNANFLINKSCCGVGESMLFVDCDGAIYPCGPFSYERELTMGSVHAGSLQSLTDNDVYRVLANRSTDEIPECRDCALQGLCRGGCPANSYLHEKSLLARDPFCDYWQGIISHLMKATCDDPSICELIPDYTIRL